MFLRREMLREWNWSSRETLLALSHSELVWEDEKLPRSAGSLHYKQMISLRLFLSLSPVYLLGNRDQSGGGPASRYSCTELCTARYFQCPRTEISLLSCTVPATREWNKSQDFLKIPSPGYQVGSTKQFPRLSGRTGRRTRPGWWEASCALGWPGFQWEKPPAIRDRISWTSWTQGW